MASRAQKYSTNEAVAFILASDSESNHLFGDESSLELSDIYDSEKNPCFCGMEVDEIQKNDQQVCYKNYYFFGHSFDVSSLF